MNNTPPILTAHFYTLHARTTRERLMLHDTIYDTIYELDSVIHMDDDVGSCLTPGVLRRLARKQ